MSDGHTITPPSPGEKVRREAPPDVPAVHREKLYGYLAEFTTPADIYHAAERTRDAGYRWWDCCTPFPVHGLDKAMGIKPTILPIIIFFGGLTGTMLGALLQWFTNGASLEVWAGVWVRGYDFMISGKPFSSVPSWIPVMFELTILLASLTAFGCVLLLNNLPHLYHPLFKSHRFARVTDDRFFLVIEARDPMFSREKTRAFVQSLGPASIEELEA